MVTLRDLLLLFNNCNFSTAIVIRDCDTGKFLGAWVYNDIEEHYLELEVGGFHYCGENILTVYVNRKEIKDDNNM